MTDQIISRTTIRARARAAFEAGRSRDDHNMNWHAPALADWLAAYDQLATEQRHEKQRHSVKATGRGRTA